MKLHFYQILAAVIVNENGIGNWMITWVTMPPPRILQKITYHKSVCVCVCGVCVCVWCVCVYDLQIS